MSHISTFSTKISNASLIKRTSSSSQNKTSLTGFTAQNPQLPKYNNRVLTALQTVEWNSLITASIFPTFIPLSHKRCSQRNRKINFRQCEPPAWNSDFDGGMEGTTVGLQPDIEAVVGSWVTRLLTLYKKAVKYV